MLSTIWLCGLVSGMLIKLINVNVSPTFGFFHCTKSCKDWAIVKLQDFFLRERCRTQQHTFVQVWNCLFTCSAMLCTVVVVVIICKNIVVVLLTSTACATWQQLGRSGALTCTTHALLSSICVEVSWSRCLATVALLVARQPEALLQHFAFFFLLKALCMQGSVGGYSRHTLTSTRHFLGILNALAPHITASYNSCTVQTARMGEKCCMKASP